MSIIKSPNTVLANSLSDALDILRPRVEINKPSEIVFCVGTQINGIPHIGTYIVQCASFILAQKAREKFGIRTSVEFGALDNAPYDVVQSVSKHAYQRTYYHALPKEELNGLVQGYYLPYFGKLQELTNVPFEASTYTDIQGNSVFRKQFLTTLKYVDLIGWCVGPATGTLRVRIPCPKCHYAEKYADRTELVKLNDEEAIFRCMCLNHGSYEVSVVTVTFLAEMMGCFRHFFQKMVLTEFLVP
jgi:hypothetical protein